MLERLHFLQACGHEIRAEIALNESFRPGVRGLLDELKTPLESDSHYVVDGIKAYLSFGPDFSSEDLAAQPAMEKFFAGKIAEFQPDFVIAHYTDFFAVTSAIKWRP